MIYLCLASEVRTMIVRVSYVGVGVFDVLPVVLVVLVVVAVYSPCWSPDYF